MATLTFLGAAQEVTGSCHLLESPEFGKLLLDCGMHQGGSAVERLQEERFAFDAKTLDAVILSHAHLDHSGLLPKLVNEGFNGKIYCTEATSELLVIMLEDAASIYERDLERDNLRRMRRGKDPVDPEYTDKDVKKALRLCSPHAYNEPVRLAKDTVLTFHDAGHILGSAIVELKFKEQLIDKSLVFSGDLGKQEAVLMNPPTVLHEADVVLMEGTYGNRNHRTIDDTLVQLEQILRETWKKNGVVLIPAFAVGRTQELLFHLGKLAHEGKLDPWQVILDSPMAISVTKLYDRWLHTMDCEGIRPLCEGDQSLLRDFLPHLSLTPKPHESMAINKLKSGAIIIAGSGMCTGGRIRHHFKHRIWNKNNTVIFSGFQAGGTLGRILVEGAKKIRLFGEEFVVNARIETLGGFSAHAGQTELIDWISQFKGTPRIMLVHGEAKALDTLSQKLWLDKGISSEIPVEGRSIAF